jgi:chaperonin GroES
MRVEPIYDRILVQQDAEKETVAGSELIVAADEFKEKPFRGTVVAAGVGRLMDNGERVPLLVKVGDRVFFGRHNGVSLPEETGLGERMLIMREDEIMGVLRD